MVFTTPKVAALNTLISEAKKIVITAHKSPDGDSVGSSLALYHYLRQEHDHVTICHPDPAPHFLHWMPEQSAIMTYEEKEKETRDELANADLIFSLDYNSPGRIGKMEDPMTSSSAKRVMIDHHRDPDLTYSDVIFSDIASCSTAQLIYQLIEARGHLDRINAQVAECIYTGIITDTGSFRFSSVTQDTHRIAAALLSTGINHSEIHENIYDTNSENRMRLTSYALLEKLVVQKEDQVAYISLTQEEQERFSATKGDTEGLVNQALSLNGIRMAVFFKEADGIVKISFRSKGMVPVNQMAKKHFHGGGHLNASGGKHIGKMEDAIQKFVTILPKFVTKYKDTF